MSFIRKITARDKPETIARFATSHEEHLRAALRIALRRAHRSAPLVRELLASATVEGLAARLNAKASAVTFHVPLLRQWWHQLIPWQYLTDSTPADTATTLAWSLRESIRRSQPSASAREP